MRCIWKTYEHYRDVLLSFLDRVDAPQRTGTTTVTMLDPIQNGEHR